MFRHGLRGPTPLNPLLASAVDPGRIQRQMLSQQVRSAATALPRQVVSSFEARATADCEAFLASRPDVVQAASAQGLTTDQLLQLCATSPSQFKSAAGGGSGVGKLVPFYKNPWVIGGVAVAGLAAYLVLR